MELLYRYRQKRMAIRYLSRANRGLLVYRYIVAPLLKIVNEYDQEIPQFVASVL